MSKRKPAAKRYRPNDFPAEAKKFLGYVKHHYELVLKHSHLKKYVITRSEFNRLYTTYCDTLNIRGAEKVKLFDAVRTIAREQKERADMQKRAEAAGLILATPKIEVVTP